MRTVVAIMLAGAIGALLRYEMDGFISDQVGSALPWGTFVVNISGAFALGLLLTLFTQRITIDPSLRFALTTGLIGSYTTFSTLTYETLSLIQQRSYGFAFANSVGSLLLGLMAAALGVAVAGVV